MCNAVFHHVYYYYKCLLFNIQSRSSAVPRFCSFFFKEVAQASFCSWQQYLQAAKDFTTLQNEPFRTHSSSKMIGEIRHGLRAPPSWPGIMPFPGAGEDGDAARGSLWCWQASPFLFSDQLSSFSARYATLWKITPIYACHVVIFFINW